MQTEIRTWWDSFAPLAPGEELLGSQLALVAVNRPPTPRLAGTYIAIKDTRIEINGKSLQDPALTDPRLMELRGLQLELWPPTPGDVPILAIDADVQWPLVQSAVYDLAVTDHRQIQLLFTVAGGDGLADEVATRLSGIDFQRIARAEPAEIARHCPSMVIPWSGEPSEVVDAVIAGLPGCRCDTSFLLIEALVVGIAPRARPVVAVPIEIIDGPVPSIAADTTWAQAAPVILAAAQHGPVMFKARPVPPPPPPMPRRKVVPDP